MEEKKDIKIIHYSELDDMERYNKEFDRNLFKDMEEGKARKIFREWYNNNLPIDLLSWSRANIPDDDMIYKNGYWKQILLIRDDINAIFYTSSEEYNNNPVMVINTHRSKSIKLPVYEINIKKYDLKLILRYNFYNWKISVISKRKINMYFMDLFNIKENINKVYCEGFKDGQVFPSYNSSKDKFTLEIRDDYRLYTFMYILNNYFKKIIKYETKIK